MKLFKNLTAVAIAVSLLGQTALAAVSYDQKIWANEAFTDVNTAEQISDMLILAVDTSYGFVNNIKSKISESVNLAPYRVASEIYIPLEYSAKAMKLEVTENESGITVKGNGKSGNYSKENAEVRYNTLFVSAQKFAEEFDFELTISEDLIVITTKDNPFDKDNKELLANLKTSTSYEWNSFQIHAYGWTTGVFVHPKNPDIVWARTDVGGAYKLDLESDKWICMTDCISGYNENGQSMWMHQPVESLALDPNDENTIYIACGNSQYTTDMLGAVYKSTDGGLSWKMTGLRKVFYGSHPMRMAGELLAVDPNNSDIVYCGTYYDGFWKSEDAGETWTNVSGISAGVRGTHDLSVGAVVVDPKETINGRSSTVYVGVASTGIYQSTDGGNNFSLMPDSPKGASRMLMHDNKLYVGSGVKSNWAAANETDSDGFFVYDKGVWTNLIENAALPNKKIQPVYIDEKNPDIILLGTMPFSNPRKIYHSRDGGKSWTDYTLNDTYNANTSAIVKDPKTENGVLIAWGFGVSKIPDITAEKLEFEIYDAGIEELMFREIRCLPEGSALNWVAGCCDKGCIISKGGNDWSVARPPTHNFCLGVDFCEEDPNIIARAHEGHQAPPTKIIISEDCGVTWKESAVFEGTTAGNIAVGAKKQANGSPVMLTITTSTDKEAMYRSLDTGETWEKIEVPFSLAGYHGQRKYLVADRVNGNIFYFWSKDGFLYKTEDCGTTWNKISSIIVADYTQYMDTPFGEEGHLWACLGKNGLSYSTDFGVRWTNVPGMTEAKGITFGKPKEKGGKPTVFVMGKYNGQDGIFRSDDYGKSWILVSGSFSYGGATESAYLGGDRNTYGKVWLTTNGRGMFYGSIKGSEDIKPIISINNELMETVISEDYTLSGRLNVTSEVRVNDEPAEVAADGYFTYNLKLERGENEIRVEAVDENKNVAEPVYLKVVYDPDYINIDFENEAFMQNKKGIVINGKANRPLDIDINGVPVAQNEDNSFSFQTDMALGRNEYTVTARTVGVSKTFTVIGEYETDAPIIEYSYDKEVVGDGVIVTGKISKDGEVRINGKDVPLMKDNSFKYFLAVKPGEYPVIIQARDKFGNVSKPVIEAVNSQKLTDFSVHDGNIAYAGNEFKLTGDVYKDFGELPYTCNLVYVGETSNVTSFGLRWDEEALYVGAEVIDPVLMSTGVNLYDRDCLEVYVDGKNSRVDATSKTDSYKQFLVPFEGSMTDGIERITTLIDGGYTMEIKIPWSQVGKGVTVSAGQKIGFDLDNCDTSGSAREAQVGWNGTSDSYRRTDYYATMTLVK